MTDTRLAVRAVARAFNSRADAQHMIGPRRDKAALEFFCGAHAAAEASGETALASHLEKVALFFVSILGHRGVTEVANWADTPAPKAA